MHKGMPMRLTLALLMLLAAPALARAQEGRGAGALSAAEEAYLDVDFERTRDRALEALRAGGLRPQQLVRCYMLLGVASSALRDEDDARDYFVRMLGVDPDAQLDESVNPQMRDPYLEARGMWAARPGRLEIEAGLDRNTSSVRVELQDPTDMARRVRIAARLEGDAVFTTAEYAAAATLSAPVTGAAGADRVEYYVEILDAYGNTLRSEGTEFEPRVVGRMRGGSQGGNLLEDPILWIIVGGVAVVAAAVAIGIIVDQRSRIGIQTGIRLDID